MRRKQPPTEMTPGLNLVLPYPPTVNHYWRLSHGVFHVSTEGQRYRLDVQAKVLSVYGLLTPLTCRLAVYISTHAPDRRQRDLDNVLKATLDAMKHARVYKDDSQIDDLSVYRGDVDPKEPRIQVSVMPV